MPRTERSSRPRTRGHLPEVEGGVSSPGTVSSQPQHDTCRSCSRISSHVEKVSSSSHRSSSHCHVEVDNFIERAASAIPALTPQVNGVNHEEHALEGDRAR